MKKFQTHFLNITITIKQPTINSITHPLKFNFNGKNKINL